MSEVDSAGGGVEQGVTAIQAPLTAGRMMRNAREAAGLHVAALAVSMKIPVKKLEALEADRLDLLHDAVFVRALASSVCRTLKIDPAPVLDKLPMNMAPRLNPDERGINAPFRTAGETASVSLATFITRPPVLIVIALLVGVIGVAFFPDIKVSESSVEVATPVGKPEVLPEQVLATKPLSVEVVETPATAVAVAPLSVASETRTPTAPQAVPSSPAPIVAKQAASAPTPAIVASAVVRGASAPAIPTTGLVVFKARATSWVKVVDAKGVVQLSKTLGAGEVAGASGPTPLSVVVGRVDMTDVEVRGNVFDITGVAKENVARFEVK